MDNKEVVSRVSDLYNYVQSVRNDLMQVDEAIGRLIVNVVNKKNLNCTGCNHLDRDVCILGPGNNCTRRAEDYYEK